MKTAEQSAQANGAEFLLTSDESSLLTSEESSIGSTSEGWARALASDVRLLLLLLSGFFFFFDAFLVFGGRTAEAEYPGGKEPRRGLEGVSWFDEAVSASPSSPVVAPGGEDAGRSSLDPSETIEKKKKNPSEHPRILWFTS